MINSTKILIVNKSDIILFSYSTNGFWINFSFLPQVTNFVNNKLDLNGHERFQARLLFSYEL